MCMPEAFPVTWRGTWRVKPEPNSICLSQPDDPMTDPIRIFLTVTYYVSERTNELATLPPLRGSIKDPLSFQHARNSALSLAFSCRHSLHVRVHW